MDEVFRKILKDRGPDLEMFLKRLFSRAYFVTGIMTVTGFENVRKRHQSVSVFNPLSPPTLSLPTFGNSRGSSTATRHEEEMIMAIELRVVKRGLFSRAISLSGYDKGVSVL